jgi:hypothetical protein
MTVPDIIYEKPTDSVRGPDQVDDVATSLQPAPRAFPPAKIDVTEEIETEFINWLELYVQDLMNTFSDKHRDWADQEKAYRALSDAPKSKPYVGADTTVIPAIAMAVDPIHARLDVGIFKQDPVFQLKGLKKSVLKYIPALTTWINFYVKHKLHLRQVAAPRMLECAKLGTMVFKTVYDRQSVKVRTYDQDFKVISKVQESFRGPRVFGVSIDNFYFPPGYQFLHDCPIVFEVMYKTYNELKVAESSGKLVDCAKVKGQETPNKTNVEEARQDAVNLVQSRQQDTLEIIEAWCDYDIDGDGLPEQLVATYHRNTRTLLQLRYNWYFHQRKPYTVIPYTVTNGSLLGIGICEMVLPFQKALTKMHQMAVDNAYLANIRMFIVKKESGIEEVPRLYAGRCFFVDDPKSDFIPFAAGDIYPSTLVERQNLFGMVEKRTGVSDYLTGRESPIIGTRATATSTLALIKEGTQRVEEVLENIRVGFAEIIENCMYLWIQYGLDDLDDTVFGDSETGRLLREFFDTVVSQENINGAIAIDLTATDASTNRQAMQQMQLAVIQIMMQYLEKVLAAGHAALQLQASSPQAVQMIVDVMNSAKAMFTDLLNRYEIKNVEDYLPDLARYLGGPQTPDNGATGGPQLDVGGPQVAPGIPPGLGAMQRSLAPSPGVPGGGGGPTGNGAASGGMQGLPRST